MMAPLRRSIWGYAVLYMYECFSIATMTLRVYIEF